MTDLKTKMAEDLQREMFAVYKKGRRDGLELAVKLLETRVNDVRGTAEHNIIHEHGPLIELLREQIAKESP